jgi:hypothetical protein
MRILLRICELCISLSIYLILEKNTTENREQNTHGNQSRKKVFIKVGLIRNSITKYSIAFYLKRVHMNVFSSHLFLNFILHRHDTFLCRPQPQIFLWLHPCCDFRGFHIFDYTICKNKWKRNEGNFPYIFPKK